MRPAVHGTRGERERSLGTPDLVLARLRAVIFVHGCFWHQHDCPRGDRRPATNAGYWNAKLQRNVDRDRLVQRTLRGQGWRVLVVWECELKDPKRLRKRLRRFLERGPTPGKKK